METQVFPEPTVGVFIINDEGKVLLLQSHKWPGKYVVPGGHVELGERIEQAAVREAREETGLEVYDLQFLCWQEFIFDESFWQHKHFIFFDFACKCGANTVKLNDEAESFIWIEPEKALNLPMDVTMQKSLNKYLSILAKNGEIQSQFLL
jgi:nucleoside triphosphatase